MATPASLRSCRSRVRIPPGPPFFIQPLEHSNSRSFDYRKRDVVNIGIAQQLFPSAADNNWAGSLAWIGRGPPEPAARVRIPSGPPLNKKLIGARCRKLEKLSKKPISVAPWGRPALAGPNGQSWRTPKRPHSGSVDGSSNLPGATLFLFVTIAQD